MSVPLRGAGAGPRRLRGVLRGPGRGGGGPPAWPRPFPPGHAPSLSASTAGLRPPGGAAGARSPRELSREPRGLLPEAEAPPSLSGRAARRQQRGEGSAGGLRASAAIRRHRPRLGAIWGRDRALLTGSGAAGPGGAAPARSRGCPLRRGPAPAPGGARG